MKLFPSRHVTRQLYKYIVVGVASNAIAYSLYLLITWIGLDPILAMSLIYASACLASFFGNKKWTFADATRSTKLLPRYVAIQIVGYLTNLALLLILHKQYGLPHQWVELVAIAIVGPELFLLSKYFVFRGVKAM